MALRVVGAGLGRTGTNSLKVALERLLGGRCYHMIEVDEHPADVAEWRRAVRGEAVDWDALLAGYVASVDWPGCAFWRELSTRYPQALVLLSTRESAQAWWRSVEQTIVVAVQEPVPEEDVDTRTRREMIRALLERTFTPEWRDGDAAMAAYERHNGQVRAGVPAERLIEWRPGDDWGPLCSALGLTEPEQPFPHLNSTAEFRATLRTDVTPPA